VNATRPYQRAAIDLMKASIAAGKHPLLVSPTGSGKSFTGATLVHEINVPTLWLAHRRELVEQAADELSTLGINVGVCMPGKPFYPSRQVIVASVLTAAKRDIPGRRLIVADESHHIASASFRNVLAMHPGSAVSGLTATPYRLDNRPLGDVFNDLIIAGYEDEMVATGFLVEPKVFAPPIDCLEGLKVDSRTGEFSSKETARRFDKSKLVGDIVQSWKQHADGMLTLGFACSVEHSEHLVQQFRAAGISAEHCDGETPPSDRAAIIRRLKAGHIRVLFNVGLFTEGFNLPAIECVLIARPTASLTFHKQTVGRAMRVHPGKRYPVVLDHAGNFLRHGRITRRIEYSLDGNCTAPPKDSGLRTCPKCFRLVSSSRSSCLDCGLVFATACNARPMPTTVDGALQMYTGEQLDAAMLPADQAEAAERERDRKERDRTWFELLTTAKRKGFKPAWASWEFKRKYGEWRQAAVEESAAIEQLSGLMFS
jgi:superfamily II DNA or RNA helicase